MTLNDEIRIATAVLEREMVHAAKIVDPGVHGLRIDARAALYSDTCDRLLIAMRGYVWSQKIQDETVMLSVEYPADWWQAIKQRFFPARALSRWPVRMAKKTAQHTFRTVALFPGFKHEAPDHLGPMVIKTFVRQA